MRARGWSGRQDLNLRPPGPELRTESFPSVRRLFLPSQALEIRTSDKHAKPLNPRRATRCEARFVAPVSPAARCPSPTWVRRRSFRSERSLHAWVYAAPLRTDCASEANYPMFGFRTPYASLRHLSPPTWPTMSGSAVLRRPIRWSSQLKIAPRKVPPPSGYEPPEDAVQAVSNAYQPCGFFPTR